jgi:hypothetical protein
MKTDGLWQKRRALPAEPLHRRGRRERPPDGIPSLSTNSPPTPVLDGSLIDRVSGDDAVRDDVEVRIRRGLPGNGRVIQGGHLLDPDRPSLKGHSRGAPQGAPHECISLAIRRERGLLRPDAAGTACAACYL